MLASLPEPQRRQILDSLSDEQVCVLAYDWKFWARPKQLPPEGEWWTWLVMTGRGWGKTRVAAEWVRELAREPVRIAIVGRTASDVRDVMVEGESGVLKISPDWDRPTYEPSKRRLTWPSGAIATTYSADEPDLLRGPSHHYAWADEMASWQYMREAWDNLQLGTRLGKLPRTLITTTPRPVTLLRELVASPHTALVRGSTYENLPNLAPAFREQILSRYEGTSLGAQELHGELLEEAEGALWKRGQIEATRVQAAPASLVRVVVGVDPSGGADDKADETGIVVAGMAADGQCYVLADPSLRATPSLWASRAVATWREHKADRIVAEANFGGDMVRATLSTVDATVPIKLVHASRGKAVRAEPIAALYEQGRVHHVGRFPELEDQLCNWTPGDEKSPDRLDALVWAITELAPGRIVSLGARTSRVAPSEASKLRGNQI